MTELNKILVEDRLNDSIKIHKYFFYFSPLFIFFFLCDYYFVPIHFKSFLTLRLSYCVVPILNYFLLLKYRNILLSEILALLHASIISWMLIYMMFVTDGIKSPYFSGLTLIATIAVCFFPFSKKFLWLTIFCIYFPYIILAVIELIKNDGSLILFSILIFNSIGTVLTGIFVNFFRENYRKTVIMYRVRLLDEKENREQILQSKIKELMKYEKESVELKIQIEKNNIFTNLATQVAHDIRSPVTALNIISQTDLVSSNGQLSKMIIDITTRINSIASDLIGQVKQNNLNKLSLNDSINNLIYEKKLQYNENLEITYAGIAEEFNVIIPNSIVIRIISNILNNSIEATNTNGKIEVALKKNDFDIQIEISDNGNGIPDNILENLQKEPLSYGKMSSEHSGTGIGIYRASQELQKYHGKIEFKSKSKSGTTAIITIPLANNSERKS